PPCRSPRPTSGSSPPGRSRRPPGGLRNPFWCQLHRRRGQGQTTSPAGWRYVWLTPTPHPENNSHPPGGSFFFTLFDLSKGNVPRPPETDTSASPLCSYGYRDSYRDPTATGGGGKPPRRPGAVRPCWRGWDPTSSLLQLYREGESRYARGMPL